MQPFTLPASFQLLHILQPFDQNLNLLQQLQARSARALLERFRFENQKILLAITLVRLIIAVTIFRQDRSNLSNIPGRIRFDRQLLRRRLLRYIAHLHRFTCPSLLDFLNRFIDQPRHIVLQLRQDTRGGARYRFTGVAGSIRRTLSASTITDATATDIRDARIRVARIGCGALQFQPRAVVCAFLLVIILLSGSGLVEVTLQCVV